MNDITALAQSHELLIANGNETANLLRHLADNEIDSDYFAVVSECESYGKETDAELSITDFALRAAGYVDALVEALEKAQRNETLTEAERQAYLGLIRDRDAQITELESRTVTVKLPERYDVETYPLQSPKGEWYSRDDVLTMLAAAGIQVIEGGE